MKDYRVTVLTEIRVSACDRAQAEERANEVATWVRQGMVVPTVKVWADQVETTVEAIEEEAQPSPKTEAPAEHPEGY